MLNQIKRNNNQILRYVSYKLSLLHDSKLFV